MSCEQYGEKLSAYIDGELDYESRGELEKHLLECPDCKARLEEMRRIEELKPVLEPPKVPQEKWRDCWEEIKKQTTDSLTVDRVKAGVASRRRAHVIRRVLAGLAMTAAVIIVAAILFWPTVEPVVPVEPEVESTVSVLDYDDSNYSLYVIDKPEYTIIKLIPVESGG